MVLTTSSQTLSKIPELEASIDDAETGPLSVPSGYLCSHSTNSDISKLQLAPSIKSYIVV